MNFINKIILAQYLLITIHRIISLETNMKLTDEIKRMLNALAYADAGECQSVGDKYRFIAGTKAAPATVVSPVATAAVGPQVGLYLGSELPAEIMQYVIQTCARLRHGLTVLALPSESEARSLLAPYQKELDENVIALRVTALIGEPPSSLIRALRRLPEVAFLVVNEAGYLGHGLLNGTQSKGGLPVPVVLVAANGKANGVPTSAKNTRRSNAA